TLGAFVTEGPGRAGMILSNNHVLADENRAKAGDLITQPGALDGGAGPDDVIGALTRFVRLRRQAPNRVDAAVATVADGVRFNSGLLPGLGRLAGLRADPLDGE